MASGMIPLEATAARQRVGSFRSRLKKQQPIMMSEPPTWGGATANPETLLRSLPTSVSSVDFPCNVAVTVHEFIDSNQEICDLWYDTIYWYKIYYLTFRFMCLGDLKLRISFRNFRDKSEANLGSFNRMNVQLDQTILVMQKWRQGKKMIYQLWWDIFMRLYIKIHRWAVWAIYRKVASTNASRFVTRLVYMHTQNDNFLIRSSSRL